MKFFGRWVSKTSVTEAPTTTMEAPAERAKDRGDYLADRAEDVTQNLKSCVETAEEARDTLSEVLRIFHPQGKQTATVDQAMGDNIEPTWEEKLFGFLGGFLCNICSSVKTRKREEDVTNEDDSYVNKRREQLEKIEAEKAKQDAILSDLSNVLSELKDAAVDLNLGMSRYPVRGGDRYGHGRF